MSCRDKHQGLITCTNKEFPYDRGYKMCKTCELYMKWEGIHCPCCGYLLRIKNRHINENKWTWETWNIMRTIEMECEYYYGWHLIKVEVGKDRRKHGM